MCGSVRPRGSECGSVRVERGSMGSSECVVVLGVVSVCGSVRGSVVVSVVV